MMNENIEQLILSGQFFNTDRSSSPTRSSSTGSEPDLDLDLGELTFSSVDDEDDNGLSNTNTSNNTDIPDMSGGGVGVGVPGRTGVKGVIRDRNEAVQISQSKRALEIAELNRKMERSNLGGKTFLEEEREKALLHGDERVDRIVLDEMEKRQAEEGLDGQTQKRGAGRFGHLREVGVKGYVRAVENEESGIWVVVHLYEPSLERCYTLDDTLSHLARRFPNTKFLRARASALGFASSSSSSSATSRLGSQPRRNLRSGGGIAARTITRSALFPSRAGADSDDDDEDDSYSNNNIHEKDYDDEDDEEDEETEEDVDTDMLPTMLVYRGGELVFNWVRVDWEAGEDGIGELLMRNHVVPRTSLANGAGDGDKLVDDGDGEIDLSWADENLL